MTTASSWIIAWRPATPPDGSPARARDHPDRTALRQTPRSVTADRGYGEPATERELAALGVPHGHYPAQSQGLSRPSRLQHARGFHQLVKWRTGCEGRISYLKRGYGWDRTRLDGRERSLDLVRARVFAHNLVKISALAS